MINHLRGKLPPSKTSPACINFTRSASFLFFSLMRGHNWISKRKQWIKLESLSIGFKLKTLALIWRGIITGPARWEGGGFVCCGHALGPCWRGKLAVIVVPRMAIITRPRTLSLLSAGGRCVSRHQAHVCSLDRNLIWEPINRCSVIKRDFHCCYVPPSSTYLFTLHSMIWGCTLDVKVAYENSMV